MPQSTQTFLFNMANSMPASSRSTIFFWHVILATLIVGRFSSAADGIETVDLNSPLLSAMRSPVTLIVDGVAFADAVGQIAMADQLNVWIDRGIDPTSPVMLGPLGPTRFQALLTLARSREAIVTVVDNVVLVGRPNAVDRAAALMAAALQADTRPVSSIKWPAATTPDEAMTIIAAKGNARALPHDLWPATSWSNLTPEVAAALVLAQFDASVSDDSNAGESNWMRRYPSESAKLMRSMIRDVDPKPIVRTSGRNLAITASSKVHRAAMETLLTIKADAPKQSTSSFSLRATESAEAILRQLTAASNKKLAIDNRAAESARVPITVEASAATVELLIDQVARQAGLTTQWTGDTVTVLLP